MIEPLSEEAAALWFTPVVLKGRWVRLEPLGSEHVDQLATLLCDEEVWRYLPMPLETVADVRDWFARSSHAGADAEVLFATVDRGSGRAIGTTRLMDIRPAHRGIEIGGTALGRRWWRTAANSESKYLLLRHCFETLDCMRVCLKTDSLNVRSQRAIERLGAQREGLLRKHMLVHGGRARDTVYYSIIDVEWSAIRERMVGELYGADVDAVRSAAWPSQ